MKRKLIIVGIIVGLLGLLFAGSALAYNTQQTTGEEYDYCGTGMAGWHGEGMFGSAVISDLLNLTPEEIRDQLIAGQSLAEIAAAQGISEEVLVGAILDEMRTHMLARVDEGMMTEEDVDQMLTGMEERITEMVNRTAEDYGETGAFGPGGMMGGYGGGMMGGYGGGMMGGYGGGMMGGYGDRNQSDNTWSGFARGMMGWGRGNY